MRHLQSLFTALAIFVSPATSFADSFFVAPDGLDDAARDGRRAETAWASLAYACERVPEGKHAIHIAPGEYVAVRTARPKSGLTIVGRKAWGTDATRIVASKDWGLGDAPHEGSPGEYLIAFEKANDIKIHSLALASDPPHRINGAIRSFRSENVTLQNLVIEEFRWAGIHAEINQQLTILECRLRNASMERSKYWGGHIRTRYLRDSEIAHNRIEAESGGYGYKGGGHTGMTFHHNYVDTPYFAFESAHENEHGVEIHHNYMTACISIPKSVQSPDPTKQGFDYTFWIHHNYLTDSYTIEGPRNHLRVDHNWIHIEKPNGRVYTHHGGTNHGPVWFHHNVVENVDRGLIWMNEGLAERIYVYNNTVFCADAGTRTGALLGAWTAERLNDWQFKNNVVVAAWSQPRSLLNMKRGVPEKISVKRNLFVNVLDVPEGNIVDETPGLARRGDKPGPFYVPAGGESVVVDRGVELELPFYGAAPDIGAFEFGVEPWTLEGIPQPRR